MAVEPQVEGRLLLEGESSGGGCDPLATPAPLAPYLRSMARSAARRRSSWPETLRPYEVARALLEDLAVERGSVVVFEDLHWADAGTRNLNATTTLRRHGARGYGRPNAGRDARGRSEAPMVGFTRFG